MRTLKSTILFLLMSVMFMQKLQAQMFTAPYQAVNYQKVISNGLTLDGVDDYVQLPAGVYFNGDYTFECWVKLNAYTNWARIFDFGPGSSTSTNQFLFGFLAGNTPNGWINSSSFAFPSGISLNTWTHLAITQSGTTLTGYVNGVSVLTTTITAPANVTRNSCFIGKSNYGDANSNMSIDEFRIWNYARTTLQIQSSLNTELVGNETGLVVYYNFNIGTPNAVNTGRTTVFNEALANTFNGTLYNSSLSGFTSNWTVGKVEPLVPSNNLRLYVDAGKPRSYPGSGSVMTDLSPSGNNMNLYNSPTYSSSNGGNLSFNGSNTYLTSVSNSPITGASPRTVCVWYNPTSISNGNGTLFWTGNNGVYYSTYGIGFYQGKYQFWGQSNDYTDVNLIPNINSWNFIAAAYGGGNTIYQYLNGTGNLNSLGNTLNTPAAQFMFASNNGTGFSGKLGNIMVFDRMLSKQELDKLYNNMKLRVPDGSSAQNAAVSGLQLHIDYPSLASGWYWIKSPTMPNPLQMYVDKTEDGGGYDFYPITAGPSVNYVNVNNGGTALGLDIVYPRSKNHWKAMSNAVISTIATSRNAGGTYSQFFLTTYGVYRVGTAGNGNGDYRSKIMRSDEYGGTTNTKDWRVKDGGMWWMRDGIYGEPNGDYTDYGFLGMGSFSNPYNLTNIEFNDGYCCSYATGNYYLVSSNTKKGVVYDNNLLLYVDPSIAGSYSTGTTVSDLSANLNHGTLSNVSFVNTATTPKKFTFNGTSTSNVSFSWSKFNTTYTGKTIIVAAKMDASFGTNIFRALFGNNGNRNFNFYVYQNGTGYVLHYSTGGGWFTDALPIVTGQWYVFAVTQDANSVKFYLNGNLVSTTTGTTLTQYVSAPNEFIGNADNFWLGDIGTTMIYKRGLTDAEIMQNYLAIKATYY